MIRRNKKQKTGHDPSRRKLFAGAPAVAIAAVVPNAIGSTSEEDQSPKCCVCHKPKEYIGKWINNSRTICQFIPATGEVLSRTVEKREPPKYNRIVCGGLWVEVSPCLCGCHEGPFAYNSAEPNL